MKRNQISFVMVVRGSVYLLSLNLLVFLRRQFGERIVGDLCVACGFSWCCSSLYSVLRIRFLPQLPEPRLTLFFLYTLSGFTACHLVCVWLRRNKPATVHSYSRGRPTDLWRLFRVKDTTLERYIQPCVCVLAAFGLSKWDRVLGYWIVGASVAVFVEEQLARARMRTRILDVIDSRLESTSLFSHVQERVSPARAAGVQSLVAEVTEVSQMRSSESLSAIVARLDPELRKMIEPPTDLNMIQPQ